MKKVFMILFMLSFITYSVDNFDSRIFNQKVITKLEVLEFINNIKNGRRSISYEVSADLFSADEIIGIFNQTDVNISKSLILLLPDVRLLKNDLNKLTKASNDITIFLASKDYKIPYIENRTIEKYKELGINLEKYSNIKVKVLDLNKEELEEALVDTFIKNYTQNNKLYIKAYKLK